MAKEEAIKILSPNSESGLARAADWFLSAQKVLRALELAVSALRVQQTAAKLDRNRWEGCYWCVGFCPEVTGDPHWDYRFCPHCGHPLTEEAWAELERRINRE